MEVPPDNSSEKRYRALFEAMRDGVLIVNDAGYYVDVNQSYCRLLKSTKERLIGSHFSEFIPPERLREASALAICQRIVEQYGGRVWMEKSVPGSGSTFCFAVPDRGI